jgi:hypothetical protein
MKKIIVCFILMFLISCSNDTFKKVFKLGSLRIIAITAGKQGTLSQAEFDPGNTVTVEAFVSDVDGGQTVSAVVESCTDLGVSYGKEPSCQGVFDRTAQGTITLNTSTLAGNTGAMPTFNITIPATILVGRSSQDQFNGVNYLVTMAFTTPDGQSVKAFKRLPVTTRATKNMNPTLGNILIDGNTFAAYPNDGDFSLSSTSSEESYQFQSADGSLATQVEDLNVAWYVSDGEINFPVTTKSGTTRFKKGDKSSLVVVAVIRDGRGGMAVQIKKVP